MLSIGNDANVTIDYFSTLGDASLSWSVSGGFQSIELNGKVISTNANGQANVTAHIRNGQENKVKINTSFWGNTGTATVTLTVEGYLATFDIMETQNRQFVSAYKSGQVSKAEFEQARDFQNLVANSMLQNGVITTVQYQALVKIFDDALPSGSGGQGGSGGSGGQGGGGNDNVNSSGSGVKKWLTAKNMAIGGVVITVLLVIFAVILGGKKK